MARLNASDLGAALAPQRQTQTASRDQYGTIALDAQGTPTIKLDGGADYSPCACLVGVHHGDRVLAHVVNHRIVVFANVTVPSVNDAEYSHVKDIAEAADELLDGVAQAAAAADKTVAEILTNADTASELVDGMQEAATTAGTTLAQIVEDADDAASTLAGMQAAATQAHTTLNGIYQDAADAKASAANAATAANAAQNKLSDVENVVGTLNWIAEHGTWTAATETAPVADRIYYTRTGSGTSQDPYKYTVVPEVEQTDNPASLGWYYLVVDESVQAYLASHLWLDNYGLNLSVDSANGYRIHQGTVDGTKTVGTYIIDPNGNDVAKFGADGARIGLSTTSNVRIDSSGFEFIGDDGGLLLDIGEADATMDTEEKLEYAEVRESIAQGEAGFVDLVLPVVTIPTGASLISYRVVVEYYPSSYGVIPRKTSIDLGADADIGWTVAGGITVAWSHANRTVRLTVTETGTQHGPVSIYSSICNILASHDGAFVQIGTRSDSATAGAATLTVGEDVQAPGNFSQALGSGCGAMGDNSFACGRFTRAWGYASHAEGVGSTSSNYGAVGEGSHAEGFMPRAIGDYSHAQNYSAVASGKSSHAQNRYTIAASDNQTAIGKYNEEDTNDEYALIIGNGTADNARSNALAVKWDGDLDFGKSGDHYFIFENTDTSEPTITHWRITFTGYGNLRLDSSSDGCETWTNGVKYFAETTRIWPVSYGGTGLTSSPSMLTNLGSTTAANVLQASPRPGITGTLAVAHGGTGITNFGDVENTSGSNVSVATSAWKQIASFSVAAGDWLVIVGCYSASNSTGRRGWYLGTESSASDVSLNRLNSVVMSATSGTCYATIVNRVAVSSATTYRVWGWQNSGSALNMSAYIRRIKLG